RPRLEEWIGAVVTAPTDAPDDGEVVTALLARAEAVPAGIAALAGVTAAIRAVQQDQEIAAAEWDGDRIPRLDPARQITPIGSVEELIDLFAAVLENEGPPDEIERVLDGVSRLCAEHPADFERRTGPLRKRARTLLASEGEQGAGYFR